MATKFQCDVCGGYGVPSEHTHDIVVVSRKDDFRGRANFSFVKGSAFPIIVGLDSDQTIELCQGCNDSIRKVINELSAKKKTQSKEENAGPEEA